MLGVTSGGPNLILDSWMELTNSTIPEEVGYWLKRSCLGQVCLMQIHTNGCTIGGHLQKPPHKLLTWNAMCNFMVICNLTALFFFAEYLFHFIYAIDDGAN